MVEPRKSRKSNPLVDRVIRHVDRMIGKGEMRPGQRSMESEISARLNVGRVPVREAIRFIAGAGVAELVPHSGARVWVFSTRDVMEMQDVKNGLMVLAAATAYAIAAITVSLLTRTDTSQSMVVWFLVIMAIGAGLLAMPDWVPLRLPDAPLIAGMGLAGALGQIALTRAFQLGEASMIAPLEYTGLVWVIGWDLLFWQQLPDAWTWSGAAIIVASGLYLLHRERRNRVQPPKPLDHP